MAHLIVSVLPFQGQAKKQTKNCILYNNCIAPLWTSVGWLLPTTTLPFSM